MRVEQLSLGAFRNLHQAQMTLLGQTVVLRGNNAHGKTNILEALYLCATGRSFRFAATRDMLAHGALTAQVRATLQRQGVRHDVDVRLHTTGRTIRVDDRHLRSTAQLLELVNMVAFFPDDLRIAKGSPEERRRFLDRAVAGFDSNFVGATLAYHKALRSRNALLRGNHEPDQGLLAAYDAQLVRYGVVMHQSRERLLAALLPQAQAHFGDVMGGELHVTLQPGFAAGDPLEAALADGLRGAFRRDRARGMTTVGPHRADLLLKLGGHPVRDVASQGQMRAVVLALKLAEVLCAAARLGSPPVLLLDDVSSELDRERTARLFAVVAEVGSQVWITTTGAASLPLPKEAQIFSVQNGAITAVAAQNA